MPKWIKKEGYSTKMLFTQKRLVIQLVRFNTGKYVHYHKQKTEIYSFYKGTGKAVIAGKEYKIKPGTNFIVRPLTKHTFINKSKKALEAFMIKINNTPGDTFK